MHRHVVRRVSRCVSTISNIQRTNKSLMKATTIMGGHLSYSPSMGLATSVISSVTSSSGPMTVAGRFSASTAGFRVGNLLSICMDLKTVPYIIDDT